MAQPTDISIIKSKANPSYCRGTMTADGIDGTVVFRMKTSFLPSSSGITGFGRILMLWMQQKNEDGTSLHVFFDFANEHIYVSPQTEAESRAVQAMIDKFN